MNYADPYRIWFKVWCLGCEGFGVGALDIASGLFGHFSFMIEAWYSVGELSKGWSLICITAHDMT